MKRKFTKMMALAALFLFSAGSVMGQNHQVTDNEEFLFTEANIGATDWVTYSTSNFSNRTRCFTGSVPNLSSNARYVTVYVTGCESFTIYAEGNGSRTLDVSIDGVAAEALVGAANACSSKEYTTNNTGNCTIVIAGNDGSVYLSSIVFKQPSCTEATFSFAGTGVQITEAETLTALTLNNPSSLTGVVYASDNESVVTVDPSTGALTKVGVGEATITATTARQDIGATTYCAATASYTVKILSTSPILESTEASLDMVLDKFVDTKTATFTISGYNLSGATSISTLPAGFTLTPSTFAIESDGTVDQEYELVYNETAVVADASVNLVFTVGSKTVTIPVDYGKEAQTAWTSVTEAKTWDFTAGQIASTTNLTATSSPKKDQTFILADFPGIVPTSDFDASALKVHGERLDPTYWQGDSITINVNAAGTVEVTFTNTGGRTGEINRRYANIQGTIVNDDISKGSMGTGESDKATASAEVVAGDVVIHGVLAGNEAGDSWALPQYLRYSKIVYTPGGTNSINDIESSKEIVSVEYYTLSGTKITEVASNGVYLKKVTYEDGSFETVKFVK